MENYLGKLITFEGGEGVGKGTQIELLRNSLKCKGYNVSSLSLYEPGSTEVGDILRILVKNKVDKPHLECFRNVHDHIKKQDITSFTQACLFMGSRAEIYDKRIKPELEKGCIVILDRSVDSTTVYQGYAQNPSLIPFIREMNKNAVGNVNIDITILLDMNVEKALERMNKRDVDCSDRFQDKNMAFHKRLREGYLNEAEYAPERIKVVNADQPPELVHRDISALVERLFN